MNIEGLARSQMNFGVHDSKGEKKKNSVVCIFLQTAKIWPVFPTPAFDFPNKNMFSTFIQTCLHGHKF